MSSRFLKSLQSIGHSDEYNTQVKTEMDIVGSYLNCEQWNEKKSLVQILKEKIQDAQRLKKRLMKYHNIGDHSEVIGFKCQVCKQVFDQPTALGGHMSKAHPNFKKEQKSLKQINEKVRESSIQKIKREQDSLQFQATGIHRYFNEGISY